jgi:hypothetical protein
VLTVQQILTMTEQGRSFEEIMGEIQETGTVYKLTDDQMQRLRGSSFSATLLSFYGSPTSTPSRRIPRSRIRATSGTRSTATGGGALGWPGGSSARRVRRGVPPSEHHAVSASSAAPLACGIVPVSGADRRRGRDVAVGEHAGYRTYQWWIIDVDATTTGPQARGEDRLAHTASSTPASRADTCGTQGRPDFIVLYRTPSPRTTRRRSGICRYRAQGGKGHRAYMGYQRGVIRRDPRHRHGGVAGNATSTADGSGRRSSRRSADPRACRRRLTRARAAPARAAASPRRPDGNTYVRARLSPPLGAPGCMVSPCRGASCHSSRGEEEIGAGGEAGRGRDGLHRRQALADYVSQVGTRVAAQSPLRRRLRVPCRRHNSTRASGRLRLRHAGPSPSPRPRTSSRACPATDGHVAAPRGAARVARGAARDPAGLAPRPRGS